MVGKSESTGKAKAAGKARAVAPKAAASKAAAPKAGATKTAAPKTAAPTSAGGPRLKITQIGSPIGRKSDQRVTLKALGLNKMNRSNEVDDTSSMRGMLRKVAHLLRIEPAR